MHRLLALLLLAIVLAAVLTFWRVEQRRAAALDSYPPEGNFVEVDGHPVHYVQLGSGPDVVLIHGASGSTRDMTFSLAPRLSDRYRVTIFDRPGLGHTPHLRASGVTVAEQADLLVAASAALGLTQPVVVGQSLGGAVMMAWAVHHPDAIAAAVSVAGATYPWEGELNRFYATLAKPVIGPVLAHLAGAWVSPGYVENQLAGVFAPQEPPEGYAEHIGIPLILRPESLRANAQQRTDLREELRALAPRYDELTLPMEIVHGTADTTVWLPIHSEPLAREVEGAHLTPLPGIGHMPHHVAEDEVVAAIDRAVERAGLR